jgi:aminopeptidase N
MGGLEEKCKCACLKGQGECGQAVDLEGDSDTFLRGLSKYLRDHKFGNANSDSLWSSLKDETELDIPDYMEEWTFQPGYPLVTVTVDGPRVFVSQVRFPKFNSLSSMLKLQISLRYCSD